MNTNLVDIVRHLISLITLELSVVSIDSGKVYLCNTLHLTLCKIVKDEFGNEYEVTEFVCNEYVVLTPYGHDVPFSGSVVIAPEIYYFHGDPKSTNNEYLQFDKRTANKTPFIWLVESYIYDQLPLDSAIEEAYDVRLFFLDWAETPKWENDDHNNNVIKPMQNLQKAFLQVIEDDYNYKRLENVRLTVRNRFGATAQNPEKLIIDEDLTGLEASFRLQVYDLSKCKC